MESAKGEARAWGLQAGYGVGRHLALEADVSQSHNSSWQGSTTLPPPAFATTTTYFSARAGFRTDVSPSLRLEAKAGPAVIVHGGSGSSSMTRNTDIGGVVELAALVPLTGPLGMTLAAGEYLYASRYRDPYAGRFAGSPVEPAGSVFRHDLLLQAGLNFRLR